MRTPDWDVRLARWATLRTGERFRWGQTDCVLLCLEAFDVMTGSDKADAHRGRWRSRAGALRYQRENDTDLLRGLRAFGCVDVEVGFQQRGDFIIVERSPIPHGLVCFGEKSLGAEPHGQVSWSRLNFAVPQGLRVLRAPG